MKNKTKVGPNTDETVDKEIAWVLIKMCTPNTIPVKKNVSKYIGTPVRKIKTISQAIKSPKIHIPYDEGEQYDDESYGGGNLDIEDIGKEVIPLNEF